MEPADQRIRIVIAMPLYDGLTPETSTTLLQLVHWLTARGMFCDCLNLSATEIARGRNKLTAAFLERREATHLLFIDNDMVFKPEAVEALIKADRPLVGAVYPKRQMNLDAIIAAARKLTDRAQIIASGLQFVIYPEGPNAEMIDGGCRVAAVGMGLTLIRREVFTKLLATGAIREDRSEMGLANVQGPTHGFFDPIIDGPEMLSEDYSFCRRWRTLCQGEVWGVLDQSIGHVGPITYEGRIIDALAAASQMRR